MPSRLVLGSLLAALAGSAAAAGPFSFGVFGDMPYNRFEREHLPHLLAEMDAENLAVVIHDGDLKSGSEPCDDALYADRLAVFESSHHPFVFVPGDNDWTDCHRPSNGAFDPLERLTRLRSVFFPRLGSLGRAPLALHSQAEEPAFAAYREHLRWQGGPLLFVTLNVPGSNNNHGPAKTPGAESVARGEAVHQWIAASFAEARKKALEGIVLVMQADMDIEDFSAGTPNRHYRKILHQLLTETQAFSGEVLLVHGDSHVHRIDQPLRDPATRRTVSNFTRLETYGSPFLGWVKVEVTAGTKPLFRYTSRPYSPGSGQ